MTNTVDKYTYGQLLDEVEVLAGVLREEGVRKGDVVMIYSKYSLYQPCHLRNKYYPCGYYLEHGQYNIHKKYQY